MRSSTPSSRPSLALRRAHALRPHVLAAVLFAPLAVTGCSRHVLLSVPDTTGVQRYVCDKQGVCVIDPTVDPALSNQLHTLRIELPRECQGRFQSILIRDADSGDPRVIATCAPLESDIPTAGGG